MRLVSWNCQMAFSSKRERVLALKPDVLIVPESSKTDVLSDPGARSAQWLGQNTRKGLGVMSFGDTSLVPIPTREGAGQYALPVQVHGATEFTLVAIWAMRGLVHRERYVGQVHQAIDRYADLLTSPVALMGDFNSNAAWDRVHPEYSHSRLVGRLAALDIYSAYHFASGELHGEESRPTMHLYRSGVAYHIDYCFASSVLLAHSRLEIGGDEWLTMSDHVPLVWDIA